jgi:hypothetical protein
MDFYKKLETMGYAVIGDIDWVDSYEYDITLVLRADGELFYVEDSGCSCDSPWQYTEPADVTGPVTREALQEYLESRNTSKYDRSRYAGEIADLMLKVVS